MQYKIDTKVARLIKILGRISSQLRISAYLVGGPVRDLLLGKSNVDLDIAVNKDLEKLVQSLSKEFKAEFVYHRQFKTATLFLDALNIDMATTRKEIYPSYGTLPQVRDSSLERDLFRRDFTINAMAVRIERTGLGDIVDPYNGLSDLKNKKIRILHNKSFLDDPTRIIRALRFQTRLGFGIERQTSSLLKEAVSRRMFSKVTAPRIGNEIVKLLKENEPLKAIKRLDEICGLTFIHPKIKFNNKWNLFFRQADRYGLNFSKSSHKKIEHWIIYFIALMENLNRDELDKLCRGFELKRQERMAILHASYLKVIIEGRMVEEESPSIIYGKLKPMYPEAVIYIIAGLPVSNARKKLFDLLVRFDQIDVGLDGEDLKKMGFIPGPIFNKILEAVFLARLDGRIFSRREETDFVQRNFSVT